MPTHIDRWESDKASGQLAPAARSLASRIGIIVAVLVVVASVLSIAVIGRSIEAPQMTLASCRAIHDDTRRLACFDRVALQTPQQPAKGANVPLIAPGAAHQ
jgi:hypothetical protein